MTKVFLTILIALSGMLQQGFAQDSTKNSLPRLLSLYYNLKDALVSGNADLAAEKAAAFITTANGIDRKAIGENNLSSLQKDAAKISETKDLKKQRESFASFSTNMAKFVKTVKLTGEPVYLAYCPMKKASWLSKEKAIRNPYYGSSMLTCGEVTETIQ